MKQAITELVTIDGWVIVKGSTRGCGNRYVMTGKTPSGESLSIETNPVSASNQTCSFQVGSSRVFQMKLRSRGGMGWFADAWDNSASSGVDLESKFERLQGIAVGKEQNDE